MAVVKWPAVWLILLLHLTGLGWASHPPKVIGKPSERHLAKKGKDTRLVCPIEFDEHSFLNWRKDGEKIDEGWARYKINQKNGHLKITNVHMADAGHYVCKVANGFGNSHVNYTVIVVDQEKGLMQEQDSTFPVSPHEVLTKDGMSPEFKDKANMLRDQNLQRPVGSTVRLKCRAKGNPEPRVTWFFNDMPHNPEQDAKRRPHFILKLAKLKEWQSGSYTCMVSNRLGHLNFTYTLEVIDQVRSRPKLISRHPQNTTVEAGGTASFQCRIKSRVKPDISWVKLLEEGDEVHDPERTFKMGEHKFVVLRTPGQMVTGPNNSYLFKLVLHSVTPKDSGMYLCTGRNLKGYSTRSAFLNVVPAGSTDLSTSSSSSRLPMYIGIPLGCFFVLGMLAFMFKKCCKCGSNNASLKRHRLPVPTHERDAGFYNTYHPSPTTTNTVGGGTTGTTATITSGSNTVNMHCNNSLHTNSLQLSREVMPKTPAPSVDFDSDISSISHSQPHSHSHGHPHHQMPHHLPPLHGQQSMHYLNPHIAYGY